MKLLHTGDLHLDSAFHQYGVLGGEAMRERGRAVLRRIFALAEAEQCDLILIAGDLFDSRVVTHETEMLFCSLVTRFQRPVLVSPGNHDPYEAGSFYAKDGLPENLYVFNSKEVQCYEFPECNVAVYGYAFSGAAMPDRPLLTAQAPEKAEGEVRLLCAHGDLSDPLSKYAPVTRSDLDKFAFDYAAMGHVHNRSGSLEQARYCGCPEGRSFDEEGEGGVWLVTVENGETEIRRCITSEYAFYIRELDVSGANSPEEILSAAEGIASQWEGEVCNRICLRLVLTGMTSDRTVEEVLLRGFSFGNRFASFEVKDRTVPTLNGAYLAKDTGIRGAFYRTLAPKLESDDPAERQRALYALRIGLLAIEDKNFVDLKGETTV